MTEWFEPVACSLTKGRAARLFIVRTTDSSACQVENPEYKKAFDYWILCCPPKKNVFHLEYQS